MLNQRNDRGRLVLMAISLMAVVWVLYGSARNFDFVNLDDPVVVAENPMMQQGLSSKSLQWAMKETGELNLWHPLTWVSHLAVAEFFGIQPGAHHLVGVFLHVVNILLLLMLTRKLTQSLLISGIVAVLFAVHPQRVEAVVWISSRKELLAAMFVFLCLLAWIRSRETSRAGWMVVAWLALVAALLSKPIAVVVPMLLPLVDGLLQARGQPVPRQKWILWPFLGAAMAVSLITISLQQLGGHAELGEKLPLLRRLELMPVMFAHFVRQSLVPGGLKLFVPAPSEGLSTLAMAGAGVAIFAVLTAMAWRWRKDYPLGIFGLSWCLLFLLPVSGIVPVSIYLTADRYTYLPHFGLILALSVCVNAITVHRPRLAFSTCVGAVLIAGFWSVQSHRRIQVWKDSISLFTAETEMNSHSLLGHIHLAAAHLAKGNAAEALTSARRAVELQPSSGLAQVNLAEALRMQGNVREAICAYKAAIQCGNLRHDTAWIRLAESLNETGDESGACATYEAALARPGKPSLALLLSAADFQGFKRRDRARAIELLEMALTIKPNSAVALRDSGLLLVESGETASGVTRLLAYLALNPGDRGIQNLVAKLTANR